MRVRCRHCHLTIAEAELGDGPCPECLETTGQRRSDFERLGAPEVTATKMRCDDCGLVIGV